MHAAGAEHVIAGYRAAAERRDTISEDASFGVRLRGLLGGRQPVGSHRDGAGGACSGAISDRISWNTTGGFDHQRTRRAIAVAQRRPKGRSWPCKGLESGDVG